MQLGTTNELTLVQQGYVEAMFFTECHSDNPELENATIADLADETLDQIKRDCEHFVAMADAMHLLMYGEHDDEQIGRDLWFSRNGHGVGFWDQSEDVYGSRVLADALHTLAKAMGVVDVYRGDDGCVYLT